jgi:hypothetical protein
MLKEIILSAIAAIGALCGLGITLIAASAPNHFPNAPLWAVHAAFWGGIAIIALVILGATLLFLWQDWRPRLGPGIVLNLATAAIALALVWHYSPIHPAGKQKGLPGFTAFAFVRLDSVPAARDRYVFDQATSDGAGAAFYQLASSSLFIFSLGNTHGDSYHVEIPVGDKGGIPVDRYIFLYCEAAIGKDSTVARVMIDGKEVRRRVLNFAMDLGKQDWKQVGVDGKTENGANFKPSKLGIGQEALSDSDIRAHYVQFAQFLKDTAGDSK